jgi:hypothetical protein
MKQTSFPVSPAFIVKAHKQACSEWKTKLETMYPSVFQTAKFKRGDRINIVNSTMPETEYVIASMGSDNLHGLISLEDGNRWTDPIKVYNALSITIDEMTKMVGGPSRMEDIKVNGVTLKAAGKPNTAKCLIAEKSDILAAYDASSSETTRAMIKVQFPDAFNKYAQLVAGPGSEGHSLDLSTVGTNCDGVNIMIGFGIAPKELKLNCLAVCDLDCEVELIKENGYTFIAFKKK